MKTCPNCGELVGTHADICFKCRYDFNAGARELQRQKREARKVADEALKTDLVKRVRMNDMYEYDVVTIRDTATGSTDIAKLRQVLDEHGREGWHLVNTFTNELGVNSSRTSAYGVSYGINATIDEIVLIFERCIKKHPMFRNKNIICLVECVLHEKFIIHDFTSYIERPTVYGTVKISPLFILEFQYFGNIFFKRHRHRAVNCLHRNEPL